ncbi:hypothetical protein ACEWY4_027994 [Coilia grayii]|uniref:Platelet endothelial cell adhesion molecule n=1 Tax=Coilia grayii TaxID=363190 RepID=A0ABD1IN23_9TELE
MALCEGRAVPLLAVLLLLGPGATGQQLSFTIDHVTLSVLPGADVVSGTNVTLRCQVQVSHSAPQWLLHSFSFLLEQATEVYAKNSSESQVDYSLLPARAAHSGAYSCRLHVLEKERSSPELRLNVSGLTTPVLTVTPREVYEGQDVMVGCHAPKEEGALSLQLDVNGERRRSFPSTPGGTDIALKMDAPGHMTLRCRMRLLTKPEAGESLSNAVNVTVRELMATPTMTFDPASGVVEGDFLWVRCAVPGFSELPRQESARLEIYLTRGGVS